MINRLSQLALREWRAEFAKPATVPALVGVAVLLTIMGPFDTNALLRPLPRFGYWLVLAFSTYSVGTIATVWVRHMMPEAGRWATLVVTALSVGIAVSAVVLALNAAAFGYWPTPRVLGYSVANIMGISAVITYLLSLAEPAAPAAPTGPAPILGRLPAEKRGPLKALSVEDHYTRVTTTKGEHLVLMRLSDAIREVGDTDGAQVHRSHWVAFAAIASARRDKDRAILTLDTGTDIPVSRANVAKVKDAGFLAK